MSSEKTDILIIEDSAAVAMLLKEFLKELHYENVHICYNGQDGIKKFSELSRTDKQPIVFLDYSLPDVTGDEVMKNIFSINHAAKIIIESANKREDECINTLVRGGIYQYLEKPIRFENLKNLMLVLKEEEKILSKRSDINNEAEKKLSFKIKM